MTNTSSTTAVAGGPMLGMSSKPTASMLLTNFIFSADCVLCGKKRDAAQVRKQASTARQNAANNQSSINGGLCLTCEQLDQQSIAKLLLNLMRTEKSHANLMRVCQLCTQNDKLNLSLGRTDCVSLDCPNTFMCMEARQELKKSNYIRKVIDQFF